MTGQSPNFLKIPIIACLALISGLLPVHAADKPELSISTGREFTADNQVIVRLRRAYAKAGYNIKISRHPLTRSLHAVNSGDEDAILMRIRGLEGKYPNLRQVDTILAYAHLNIAWHKNTKNAPTSFEDVRPGEAGYLQGVILLERLLAGKQATAVPGVDNLIRMLKAGRLRYAFSGGGILKDAANAHADIVAPQTPFRRVEMYHYLHKKHGHLQPLLTECLTEDPVIPVAD